MSSSSDMQDMLVNGEWMDAVVRFLTGGGSPALEVVAPTAIYGGILLALFVHSSSALIPIVVSMILGGVIFAAFPSSALTFIVLGILFTLAAAGQAMTWRMGR